MFFWPPKREPKLRKNGPISGNPCFKIGLPNPPEGPIATEHGRGTVYGAGGLHPKTQTQAMPGWHHTTVASDLFRGSAHPAASCELRFVFVSLACRSMVTSVGTRAAVGTVAIVITRQDCSIPDPTSIQRVREVTSAVVRVYPSGPEEQSALRGQVPYRMVHLVQRMYARTLW